MNLLSHEDGISERHAGEVEDVVGVQIVEMIATVEVVEADKAYTHCTDTKARSNDTHFCKAWPYFHPYIFLHLCLSFLTYHHIFVLAVLGLNKSEFCLLFITNAQSVLNRLVVSKRTSLIHLFLLLENLHLLELNEYILW